MPVRIEVRARDVTLLPETRPAPEPDAAPERRFDIQNSQTDYRLSFDGRRAAVPRNEMYGVLQKVAEGTRIEWQHSTNPEVRLTFQPLNRILQCLNSTPSYQLFIAGFHIGDAIGIFEPDQIDDQVVLDSFSYLVGALQAMSGKKGRLFFIPDGYVATNQIRLELLGNGKLFSADCFRVDDAGNQHVGNKMFVPYATPMGFNTRVGRETEEAWRRIADLVQKQGGYGI